MCPSAFRVSSLPVPGGGGQTCTKTFLGKVGMCVENLIKTGAGVWISISPPHTNRQTNKQTSVRPYGQWQSAITLTEGDSLIFLPSRVKNCWHGRGLNPQR